MPRLNDLGEAVMGVEGGGITSVDGTIPTALVGVEAGDWDFLDDTTIVGKADPGAGYDLYTVALPAGALVQVGDGESTYLWAGGSVWTAYAATFPGIQSNVAALEFPLAGVGDVAEDGWSALVTNFATDSNISVYDETGALMNQVSVTVFPENGLIRLRGDVLAYSDAERSWKLRNRDTNAVIPFAERTSIQTVLVPVTVGSNLYVLERDVVEPGEMLTIRLATAAQGYVITNDGIKYNPDVVWLSGTTVRVAYSTGQAELPAELVFHDINLANGAHSIATIVAGTPVFVAQPPLTVSSLPASAVPGVSSLLSEGLYRQKVIDQNGLMTRPWYLALQQIARAANGPVDLSNVTGILDQDNGGTGNTSGTTDVGITVDPDGALEGNGQIVTPLAVRVDGSTIIINAGNDLEAIGSSPGVAGSGVGVPGVDGDDGLTFVIPGPMGPAGPTGATGSAGGVTGPPGMDGEDADIWVIPGPRGEQGIAGAGSFFLIEQQTPSGTGTITFSSLGAYTHLEVRFLARGTQSAATTVVNITFNGDTGANYDLQLLQGINATASAGALVAQTSLSIVSVPAATAGANLAAGGTVYIPDYRNTTFQKAVTSVTALRTGTTAATQFVQHYGGGWRNTAAITSVTLALASGNYVAGSTFTLYGLS